MNKTIEVYSDGNGNTTTIKIGDVDITKHLGIYDARISFAPDEAVKLELYAWIDKLVFKGDNGNFEISPDVYDPEIWGDEKEAMMIALRDGLNKAIGDEE